MHITYSLKNKLIILVLTAMLPLLMLTVYVIFALENYSEAYDEIVSNMTIANSYNLDFKDEMDESIYKLVVGAVTFDTIEEDDTLESPYVLIDELSNEFGELAKITTDKESRMWLLSLLRNISTLRDRIDDIKVNLDKGGRYDENIEMLDNNIYILTELIQDDIQYYIYYQTKSIEQLKIQLNEQVQAFIFFYAVIAVFLVAFATIVTGFVLNSITGPVNKLCDATKQIAGGNFSTRVAIEGKDEIATLAESVNDMSEHLEELVRQIKEDERKMRYAELRLLQEQINPHFLYNTLDTIVWLVEGNDSEKAVNMVVSLSEFFRIVLSKGKEIITIKEEEQHIRSYLEIQQVRYQDILDYDIQIEPEIYPYEILKLTLQPLVENALYHGIKTKRAKGMILVTGKMEDDKIYFDVKDNGVGMNEAELASLRSKILKPCKETDSGFGLANVNERIRMNFGLEYGITIHSKQGEGTLVQVVIPARTKKAVLGGEMENV
ncbi:MAG: sensor histidine kinase [Lachnospiraceae bacterium]|nr:sensor histidine kinase [Lachnospiraceae bacterium]